MTQGVLHFKVQGEFVMDIARNLWAEGEAAKALKLLTEGLHGMTEGTALEIVTGKKRLSGWDNNIRLLKDQATKDNRGLTLPKSLAEQFKRKEKEVESLRKDHAELVQQACSVLDRVEEVALSPNKRKGAGAILDVLDGLDEIVGPPKKTRPRPTTDYKVWDCGWLSPEGDFYGCPYFGHVSLSFHLRDGGERTLEEQGWIKFQRDMFWERRHGEATQKQIDAIFDVCRARNIKMPVWLK